MPPTYIVFSALWPNPQLIFADFANANTSLVHPLLHNLYGP